MAPSFDSGKNTPLDIRDEPISWTTGPDGKRRVVPPSMKVYQHVVPSNAPEVQIGPIPQEAPEHLEDTGVEGIKLYASRALLKAGLSQLARAYEILRDAGLLGREGVTFAQFSKPLEGLLKKGTIQEAWNCQCGISPNRHPSTHASKKRPYKRDTVQNREKFLKVLREFSVKIALSSENGVRGSNFHTKLSPGKPKMVVRLPSEGELAELLIQAGLIDHGDINKENVFKSFGSLYFGKEYRGLVGTGEYVKRNGKRQYPRSELAKLTGCSLSTARKDAEWTDTRVEPMPEIREPFKEEYKDSLPDDHVALKRAQKRGDLPGGIHFQDYLGTDRFEYTKKGYDLCKATGTNCVMECKYQASTYYPSDKVQIII